MSAVVTRSACVGRHPFRWQTGSSDPDDPLHSRAQVRPGGTRARYPASTWRARRGAAYAVAAQAAFRALFGMPALSTLLLYGNYFTTDDDVQDSIASLAFLFAAGSAGVLLSAFITPGR
jgi:hypothetical protein